MRFLHTSDWHVGLVSRFVADDVQAVLQAERLEAIGRLGRLAIEQGVADILVAGDIYDVPTPRERTLRAPIERMRQFPTLRWHLIPGNHDAHTAKGPWERLLRIGVPENVRLHLAPEPAPLGNGAWLLPGVLTRRHASGDPTADMDGAATPEGALRIGLAHGSARGFGADASSTHNLIAPDRPARAGLGYLALGDWHGAQSLGERVWYSGTPEIDQFDIGGRGGGEALVVELTGQGALPMVTVHRVGRFHWARVQAALHGLADIAALDRRLRTLHAEPADVLAHLTVEGALSLTEMQAFQTDIMEGAGSALRALRIDARALVPLPTQADLATIDYGGFIRGVADRLLAVSGNADAPDRVIAGAALQRLFVLHHKLGQGAR